MDVEMNRAIYPNGLHFHVDITINKIPLTTSETLFVSHVTLKGLWKGKIVEKMAA